MQFDNNDTVFVRELGIDDIAAIYHLGEELFTSDLYPYLYRTWDEWEVIGLYNTDPEYCLVAEIDGELAGFILGTIITKATWTYGYILWLGVNPKFQRRGVADKLVDKVISRMIEDVLSNKHFLVFIRQICEKIDIKNLQLLKVFAFLRSCPQEIVKR